MTTSTKVIKAYPAPTTEVPGLPLFVSAILAAYRKPSELTLWKGFWKI